MSGNINRQEYSSDDVTKMQNNQDDLSSSIAQLNNFLSQGYSVKLTYVRRHDIDGQKEAFDVTQLQKEYEEKINIWLNEVANFLKEFDFQYYFHFLQPKEDALSFGHPLGRLTHALEKHLFTLEEVILRFEEKKNLAVRQEIADKEYLSDILYEITFSTHTREVKLNKIVLTKPDFNSENDNFFQFVYKNPNRPIGFEEISQHIGGQPTKRLAHIVRDLGFVGDLKTIFFPVVTKDQVMFINPISKQYALKHDLPAINFKKIGRQSEAE